MSKSAVTIELLPYHQSFTLPRAFIQTTLAGSLFAEVLEVDPDATLIPISNAAVTPEVRQLMVELAAGREPDKRQPALKAAHRYLNLPKLRVYASRSYNLIVANRGNEDAMMQQLAGANRDLYYQYLMDHGGVPNNEHLLDAIRFGAARVVALLMATPKVVIDNTHLILALTVGQTNIVRLLLPDPRVDPKTVDSQYIRRFGVASSPDLLQVLVEDGRMSLEIGQPSLLEVACKYDNVDLVRYLLTLPQINPAVNNNNALRMAATYGNKDIVELMLAEPVRARVDPTDIDNEAVYSAAGYNHWEVARLLLADPRVKATVSPRFLRDHPNLVT